MPRYFLEFTFHTLTDVLGEDQVIIFEHLYNTKLGDLVFSKNIFYSVSRCIKLWDNVDLFTNCSYARKRRAQTWQLVCYLGQVFRSLARVIQMNSFIDQRLLNKVIAESVFQIKTYCFSITKELSNYESSKSKKRMYCHLCQAKGEQREFYLQIHPLRSWIRIRIRV